MAALVDLPPQVGKHDAVLQARVESRRLTSRSKQNWIAAVERGEMVRITQLLDSGQDIDEVCAPQHSTALYVAARTNNLRVAELLLNRGANPSVLTNDLVSPAWIAISRGYDAMLELLLDQRWSASLIDLIKGETRETLRASGAGVQEPHYGMCRTLAPPSRGHVLSRPLSLLGCRGGSSAHEPIPLPYRRRPARPTPSPPPLCDDVVNHKICSY